MVRWGGAPASRDKRPVQRAACKGRPVPGFEDPCHILTVQMQDQKRLVQVSRLLNLFPGHKPSTDASAAFSSYQERKHSEPELPLRQKEEVR